MPRPELGSEKPSQENIEEFKKDGTPQPGEVPKKPELEQQSGPISKSQESRAEEEFSPEAIEEVKRWAKETVKKWHDQVNPDYIFVTETAGALYGHVLKETWKNAYPDEECPDIYRIDPKAVTSEGVSRDKMDEGLKRYFSERIKKDNAKIIVFDEGSHKPLCREEEFTEKGGRRRGISTLRRAADCIVGGYNFIDKKMGEVWVVSGKPSYKGAEVLYGYSPTDISGIFTSNRPTSKLFGLNTDRAFSSLRDKSEDESLISEEDLKETAEKGGFTLAGRIVKHSEQRKRAIAFVKKLKQIGKGAGQELHDELENSEKQ